MKKIAGMQSVSSKKKDLVAYYDGIAGGYNLLHCEEQEEKFEIILKSLNLPKNSKVLDVGCGTFFSSDYFADWDMWGIEPSGKMVDLFKVSHPSKSDRIKVGFGEETGTAYPHSFFDSVICVSAAHHFYDMECALSGINDVVKHGGAVCITLLKNTAQYDNLDLAIRKKFDVLKIVDSRKDTIYVCRKA